MGAGGYYPKVIEAAGFLSKLFGKGDVKSINQGSRTWVIKNEVISNQMLSKLSVRMRHG